jgi:hypothetical protein
MPRDGNTAILRYCDIFSAQVFVRVPALALCGTATAPVTARATATATTIFHYDRSDSRLFCCPATSICLRTVRPAQASPAQQHRRVTFSAVSSLQFPDRNSIAPADFSHRYRSLGSQESGLRTQGSGLRRGVLGPPAHAQLLELTLTRTLTAPGRAAHVACSCASRLRVTSGKNPSLSSLSLSSLSLSSLSGLREVRKSKVPDQNRWG